MGASNARNDGMSVISVTYSMCLVYKSEGLFFQIPML